MVSKSSSSHHINWKLQCCAKPQEMAASPPMSAASNRRRRNYDVFLSFCGVDTRNNFVGFLRDALRKKSITVFIDSDDHHKSDSITPLLEEAIQDSKIAVVVLSKNYSDSTWCLGELAKIMERRAMRKMVVYPVFYDVTPSEVRSQTGIFGEKFSRHASDVRAESWSSALLSVSLTDGWDLNNRSDSHQADTMERILKEIEEKLDCVPVSIKKNLIGVGPLMVEKVMSTNSSPRDVSMIGIVGMGGCGKTMIAHALFHEYYEQFDGAKFVGDIRKNSEDIKVLQKQVLSIFRQNVQVSTPFKGMQLINKVMREKKVLIVLDDVDNIEQLEALAGSLEWFGEGSRIIITTRDERVLVAHGVDKNKMHRVSLLNNEEARQLLHKVAFKSTLPTAEYNELLCRVISYAAGNPYALKCLGVQLCDMTIGQWASKLDRLEKFPETDLVTLLKWSYDGLHHLDKEIFLDIACFFNRCIKDEVYRILDSCELCPESGLSTLKEKSLITISGGSIDMHNLIQEMGRYIVRHKDPNDPTRYSRLWDPEELKEVLTPNKGTRHTKAIVMMSNLLNIDEVNASDVGLFSGMSNLRLLHVNKQNIVTEGYCPPSNVRSCSLNNLPCGIQWLAWDSCNLSACPLNFQGKKLIGLQMRHCSIDLHGNIDWKLLKNLKFLDLSFSSYLTKTPDFQHLPNLERLDLEQCSCLVEIHDSLGVHKRIVHINLRSCEQLEIFPSTTYAMTSLKIIDFLGCTKMINLPEFPEHVKCLSDCTSHLTTLSLHTSSIQEIQLVSHQRT